MAERRGPSARKAEFVDVTPPRRKAEPFWSSGSRASGNSARSSGGSREGRASLAPAAIPREFVSAMKRSLRPAEPRTPSDFARELHANEELAERLGRTLRGSERPPAQHELEAALPRGPVEPPPELIQGFREAIEELVLARGALFEKTAGQLASLAAVIAERVIARELEIGHDVLEGLVREGLDALSESDTVRVRVGRGFASAVDDLEAKLAARGAVCRFVVDPALGDYGCIVESELGEVDESVDRRLEQLLSALKPDSEAP